MSITANSKILASDVSGKIDTAGTGLTKSGTTLSLASLHSANATIGASSAGTLAYSGTFTMPYITRDIYGRVTGGGTRTLTMPAKPTSMPQVAITTPTTTSFSLPSGGQWTYLCVRTEGDTNKAIAGTNAGGTTITFGHQYPVVLSIRTA